VLEINNESMRKLHIVKDVVDEMKLSIHSSVPSSVHGWHHTRKKTLVEINNPPPCACVVLGKAYPALGGFDINIRLKGPNTP
jgi:hypothetical protein